MVRPAEFRLNEETAINNYYQTDTAGKVDTDANTLAQREFDGLVSALRAAGVRVITFEDDGSLDTPDAIFPNNWVSFHQNGDVALYPMFAENRRRERREEVLVLLEKSGFQFNNLIDYTDAENDGFFLEGTGSLVLDHVHKKAYCALSPRADEGLLIEFCEDFEYTPVIFTAYQTVNGKRLPIYHTNVMMSVGTNFAVVCADCIDDKQERKNVLGHLREDGKEIIVITEAQAVQFAGNVLQVSDSEGKPVTVMSEAARKAFEKEQLAIIKKYSRIVSSPIPTIEALGGGSARCMMAEIFLPS